MPKFLSPRASDAGAVQWADRSRGLPVRSVMMVVGDPNDVATGYVVYSGFSGLANSVPGHVFSTSDYGANWTDISGDLPNVPVNDIAIDPDLPGTVYIGTDIGVFMTSNGGGELDANDEWPSANHRPFDQTPSAQPDPPRCYSRPRCLGLATGRRERHTPAWITSIAPKKAESTAPLKLVVTGTNFDTGTTVWWNGEARPTTRVSSTEIRADIRSSDLSAAGRATVAAFTPGASGGMSNALNFSVGPAPAVDPARISSAAAADRRCAGAGKSRRYPGYESGAGAVEAQAPPLPNTLGGAL